MRLLGLRLLGARWLHLLGMRLLRVAMGMPLGLHLLRVTMLRMHLGMHLGLHLLSVLVGRVEVDRRTDDSRASVTSSRSRMHILQGGRNGGSASSLGGGAGGDVGIVGLVVGRGSWQLLMLRGHVGGRSLHGGHRLRSHGRLEGSTSSVDGGRNRNGARQVAHRHGHSVGWSLARR